MTTSTTSGNSSQLDQSQWEALLSLGAQEVFELMVGSKITHCPAPEAMAFAEYTAIVGLAGPICGAFTLRCGVRAASLIASGMLGTTPEDASPQTRDALGEVSNMVVGHFKSKLGDIGENSMLSVPTVIRGTDYRLRSLVDGKSIELTMQLAGEPVFFKLDYKTA